MALTRPNNNGYGQTPTHKKMLAILSDGLPHTYKELHTCLYDDQGPLINVAKHITQIRQYLRPKGEDIICELKGYARFYRHVRLLGSAANGYR